MKLLALVSLVALLAVGAASAATPTQYRAKVNGICRGYAPMGKILDAQMTKAQAANDYVAWGVAVRKALLLNLAQSSHVEAVPVPASLKTKIAPILARMKTVDGHSRAALADSR